MHATVRSSRRRTLLCAISTLALLLAQSGGPLFPQTASEPELVEFPGGFIEKTSTAVVRPRLTASQIQALLPSRGKFTFPAPYNTEAVRITNSSDCGGSDCVNYVGYSYWRRINNHVGSDTVYVFMGLSKARGGSGPTLYSYSKSTDQVMNLGPLFPSTSTYSNSTAEIWYFSATLPTRLYLNDGPRLLRFDVVSKQFETVFDVAPRFGADKYIFQMHSSNDDRVHSASLKNTANWATEGCVVYQEDKGQFLYYPNQGNFDECQIDKSGRWLLIKDNVDGIYGEDNRIIDLDTGTERLILDQNGAAGHSDNGYGTMVAEDNWNNLPGAALYWDFTQDPLDSTLVYFTTNWGAGIGHVSHTNARAGIPAEQQYACSSSASRLDLPRANEIVCYRLDTSLDVLVVAPVMTDLNAAGGGDDYSKLPKGNLDVTGRYFIWTSNMGSGRLDAFMVKVPAHLLVGQETDSTPPQVSILSPAGGSTVSGTVTITAGATDGAGVAGVRFLADGAGIGSEDTTSPYSVSWSTAGISNGVHTLTAIARDAAGNSTTSAPVSVTVANDLTPPVISSVASTGITSTSATITWITNEASDSQVEYGPTTAYGSATSVSPGLLTLHSAGLSGLTGGTLCHFRVKSRDAAGNLALSPDFTFTTLPTIDTSSGPVAHWKLDEGTGTLAYDSSASAYTGLLYGGASWSPDGIQYAVSFDGVDDTVLVPHRTALDAYPLTVALWMKSSATGLHGVLNKYLPGSRNGYQVFVNGGNLCAWYFRDASNFVWDGSGCTLMTPGVNDDRWHHVAFVVDASGGSLYVDGVRRAARGWTGTPGPATTSVALSFARYPGTAQPNLRGLLDEVRIYNRGLSASEVSALFSAATPGQDTTPPLISSVSASGITVSAATIAWTTDEASDSQVEYGPTTAYGSSTALDSARVTSHSVALGSLKSSTLHHFRVRSRDAAGNLAVSGDFTFTTATPQPVLEGVAWTQIVHCTATGGTLQKTSGIDSVADAGAVSQQQIASGDGYVEFTASGTSGLRFAGLSNGNPGTTAGEIAFAIRLQSGIAEVRERGVYRTDTSFASGDRFRIAVQSGVVKYYKNGALFYTSATAPAYPLLVDTAIINMSATIGSAVISRVP